jgi:hypothetical protein
MKIFILQVPEKRQDLIQIRGSKIEADVVTDLCVARIADLAWFPQFPKRRVDPYAMKLVCLSQAYQAVTAGIRL